MRTTLKKRMICLPKVTRQKKEDKPNYRVHGLVRIAGLKQTFSEGDVTNWA